MSWLNLFNGESLFVEIRQRSLRILHDNENLALPLERGPSGRLTSACKENVIADLRGLLKKRGWRPRSKAFCAIDARGVLLRQLSLPASANGDLHRVLRLKVESEFPLAPEALAWGYSRVQLGKSDLLSSPSEPGKTQLATAAKDQKVFTVAALRKEVLQDYAQIFGAAGFTPIFTVAALARSRACPETNASYAVLDVGRRQSELISFTGGEADSLKVLPWGGDDITRTIEQSLGINADEAEKLKLQFDDGPTPNGESGQKAHAAIVKSLEGLASIIASNWSGQKLFLTGRVSRYKDLARHLNEFLPSSVNCVCLESGAKDEPSAAILGLVKAASNEIFPLVLRLKEGRPGEIRPGAGQSSWPSISRLAAEGREILAQPALLKWVRLAVLLCVCLLAFPYAQAFLLKPFLAKKLARIKTEKGRLAMIDRELTFLQYLKNNQPPYLDALTVLANASPGGTRFDTVSMNRRGELSLRGTMGNAQQVVDFRSKLIKSSFFSTVTIEEQTPSPDRQRMTVRITAQCKPIGDRPKVKVEPLPAGFVPGSSPMPFPGMGGVPMPMMPGGGPAMPGPIRGGSPGGMLRGPDGVPMGPNGVTLRNPSGALRFGEGSTNSADGARPAGVEVIRQVP